MKIAIISSYSWIRRENNYGALLQYFALQKYLEGIGHEVFWIRYNPRFRISNKRSKIRILFSWAKRIVLSTIDYQTTKEIKSCKKGFNQFLINEINMSDKEYKTWEELCADTPKADMYITGSDQVWLGLNKANYLEFVPENSRKFSYGASFGKNDLSKEEKIQVREFLKKFKRISIREKEGLEICAELGREDAVQVIDPTMLLDKKEYLTFKNIEGEKPATNYLLCYFLNVYDKERIYFDNIKHYAETEKLGLKIVPVQGAEYVFSGNYQSMPDPANWLMAINNSNGIITNSFHGTVFSIIMRRSFLVVLQSGSSSEQNCRFLSLLERLGLDNRIYNPNESMKLQMEAHIDWEKVEKEQNIFKDFSTAFLQDCISDVQRLKK